VTEEHFDAGIRKVRIGLTTQDGQVLEAPHITNLSGVPRVLLAIVMAPDFVHLSWTFKRDGEALTYDIQRMVESKINIFAQEPRDKVITETAVDGLFVVFTLNCGHTYRYAYKDHDLAVDVAQLALDYACHCAHCDEESGLGGEESAHEENQEKKQ
jgi:hypothetical protein